MSGSIGSRKPGNLYPRTVSCASMVNVETKILTVRRYFDPRIMFAENAITVEGSVAARCGYLDARRGLLMYSEKNVCPDKILPARNIRGETRKRVCILLIHLSAKILCPQKF
jgi:hypothetical protein